MSKTDRIDRLIRQLTVHRTQLMAAVLMLALSAVPIASAYFYVPKLAEVTEDTVLSATLPEATWQAVATPDAPETVTAKDTYVPIPEELNLAHFFPEGADRSKVTESLAGQAFKQLMTHDEQWMSNIYNLADASPYQMAKALGKPTDTVLGKYNPNDELHDITAPDTWTINSFHNIQMSFADGDGKPVSAYSNVIDIMSMANLYTYFKGVEDYDLFLSYAQNLWDNSHSYTIEISEIYDCGGCLDENAGRREYEEAEARAEEETSGSASGHSTVAEDTITETASSVIVAGASRKKASAETPANPVPALPEKTVHESTSGVITAGQSAVQATSETTAKASAEMPAESAGETTGSGHATPADAEAKKRKITVTCPGHVDLIVKIKVIGLNEENGLFQRDMIGNDSADIEEGGWPGWNSDTMASARQLSSQDWFEKYGLSLSVISTQNPLTEEEIDSYMNQLPSGISQTRKNLIHFALSSVGKVPYYWSGKPVSPHYAGNSFGVLTTPDYKGRNRKGLDCSGWISWVYWSVTGQRLPYESTSGLAISGSRISRSELQPGDIIVRTGSDAHVIMFLGWTADGKIRCIHESSAGVNNVTVAIRDANWQYYRKLVD